MAQSGYTPIKLYLSTTAAAVPLAADLAPGELAINNNDGKLFYEDSSGVVQVIATKAGASGDVVGPASSTANAIPSFSGTTGKLIQNNSGVTIAANVVTATGFTGALNGTLGATTPATVVATQVDITAQGDLRLQDTTGGEYVALQAPATIATSYTLTLPVDDGTAGQALVTDGNGVLSWSTAASGDVYGPASATDNAIARFDLTTGKIIQNSVVTIADTTGNMAGVGTLSSGAITSSSLTSGRVPFAGTAGLIQDAAALTFDGTILSATRFAGALNGTVGATTPSTGAFTTLSGTGQLTLTNASNYNLYASGAGANYFAGNVGIATTTMSQILNVTGVNASGFVGQRIQNYTGGSGIAGVEFSSDPTYAKAAIGLLREQLNGGGTLSLYNSSSTSAANWATTDARLQIGFTGAVSLAAPAGSESLRATPVASSVNYWDFYGAATGSDPYLFASGTDTNLGLKYLTKGTGSHQFQTGTSLINTQLLIAHTASAVNYLQVTGAATAGAPALSAQGTDTNINLTLTPKGTGAVTTAAQLTLTNASDYNLYVSGVGKNFIQGGLTIGAVTTDQFAMSADGVATTAGSAAPILITYSNTSTASTGPQSRRYRGTIASPLVILSGDRLSNTISAGATSSSTISNTTSIETFATENYSATNAGSYMSFHTTTTGTIGRAERMRISGDASISLGAVPGSESLRVIPVSGAVNYLQSQGSSGAVPFFSSQGSSTDIDMGYVAKGAGFHTFYTGGTSYLVQFQVKNTASAVNYLQVTGAATAGGPALSAQGSDTNISIAHVAKGLGGNYFQSANGNQFSADATSSAVNWISATGSPTGSAPSLTVTGSDTNIDFKLITKGTGVLLFGTYTAGIIAQAGYITIKDAGGTTRRLLVG